MDSGQARLPPIYLDQTRLTYAKMEVAAHQRTDRTVIFLRDFRSSGEDRCLVWSEAGRPFDSCHHLPHLSHLAGREENRDVREQVGLGAAKRPAKLRITGLLLGNLPFLTGCGRRTHAAIFSFMAGVIPPMPMLGRIRYIP